jgi:sugar lactone lactonase YvrE
MKLAGESTLPPRVSIGFLALAFLPLSSLGQAPSIAMQSSSTSVIQGQPVSFWVGETGDPAPSIQWQESTDSGTTWANLSDGNGFSGTGTSELVISAATPSLSGVQFRAVATNISGSTTSAPATADVFPLPPADSVTYDFVILAGSPFAYGNTDGVASAARFLRPQGVAVDPSGNLYVADAGNTVIRKITPAREVTTLAGGQPGSADGTGSAAQFTAMWGVAADTTGNVYVADSYNSTIRKIAPGGVVTTLAGSAGTPGSSDGAGSAARFSFPEGIAVDGTGNVYVADSGNSTIRRITPAGVVTTLAGTAGNPGSSDGAGSAARFNSPGGVAVDGEGDVFVADSFNSTIREISPAGVVTTLAGTAGMKGNGDGTGGAALFWIPDGVATDGAGNVFVTDTESDGSGIVRKVTSSGVVTTLTGDAGNGTNSDGGVGSSATFAYPFGVAVDNAGDLYVSDEQTNVVCKGLPIGVGPVAIIPDILLQPASASVSAGDSTTLAVLATGSPSFNYQWLFNGMPISGATAPTLALDNIGTAQAGDYSVSVTSGTTTVNSSSATVAVTSDAWLTNLSARAYVAPALNPADVLIAGFVTAGPAQKAVLVRGVGPGLQQFGLSGVLSDPLVTIYSASAAGPPLAGWSTSLSGIFKDLGAFQLPAGSGDAAAVESFDPGPYTAEVTSADGKQSGIVLAELYDADLSAPADRLINLSARAFVGTGANILIAGFVVSGSTSETLLIRAVGNGLNQFNVPDTLNNPALQIYDGNPANDAGGPQVIASIQGWGGPPTQGPSSVKAGLQPATVDVMSGAGAFELPYDVLPDGLKIGIGDSAMVVTLPPGAYTAQVQGADDATGIALVEIYEVP